MKYLYALLKSSLLVAILASVLFTGAQSQVAAYTQYRVTIDSAAHQKFGLYYPVTYRFRIPSGLDNLVAQYRFQEGDPWQTLDQKTSQDFFNGVNAARFDYANNIALVSVAFSANSDNLFIRILNGQSEVPIAFLNIPQYYDDRAAAVTITLDDWQDLNDNTFNAAAEILSRERVHFTVGVITNLNPNWSLIQQWVDTGYMEVASHSRSHPCSVEEYLGTGYDYQVVGSYQDILANLNLPHPYVVSYIEPCGTETPALRQSIVGAGYLATRGYPITSPWFEFYPWGNDGSYNRALYSIDTWDWGWYNASGYNRDQANNIFDVALYNGGIYHLVDHPWQGRWFDNSNLHQHIQYIANRTNIWYAAFGDLYLYHYVQERGQVSVNPVGDPDPTGLPTQVPTLVPTNTAVPTSTPVEPVGPQPYAEYSLWNSSTIPSVPWINDPAPIEVGLKFKSSAVGYITGVRFYRGTGNTGTHVGRLWSQDGQLLAEALFTNESAYGWQTVRFSVPVLIQPETVYVVSYYSSLGNFALDRQYFSVSGYTNGLLTAFADSEIGGNGVFHYGSGGGFPDQTYGASNYWVDVLFTPIVPDHIYSLWDTSEVPAVPWVYDTNPIEVGVKFQTGVNGYVNGVRFYKGVGNTGVHTGRLWSQDGQLLSEALFINETESGWQTVLFSAPVPITANTVYIASYYSTTGCYARNTGYFTPSGRLRLPLRAFASGEVAGGNGVYRYGAGGGFPTESYGDSNYWVDVLFQPNLGVPPQATAVPPTATATAVPPTATAVPPTATATALPPTATALPPTATATALPPTATALPPTPTSIAGAEYSLWNDSVPSVPWVDDPNPVELGVKFQTNIGGYVTGIRFYKGSGNTGAHIGRLWDQNGQLLAQEAFFNETASGWQTVRFSTPVYVTPNVVYVASYYSALGNFAVNRNYFLSSGYMRSPLYAFRSGEVSGGNGVYRYGLNGGFPDQTYESSNYWVDVIFVPSP